MIAQYDYLTLILPFNGKEKDIIKEMQGDVEVKMVHQDYLTYHLQKVLDGLFREAGFGFFQSFDFNKEIFIIRRKSYEIHFRGKFFLRNGFDLFYEIFDKILSLGYEPHLSRIDMCFTGVWEFQYLTKSLMKSDFKNLEVDFKKKKKKITYIKAHNVRYDFLCYNKSAHLRRLKDKEYLSRFKDKYGDEEHLSRMEVRLHNRHNLDDFTKLLLTSPKTFFKLAASEFPIHIHGRMKPTKKMTKTLTLALDELAKSL